MKTYLEFYNILKQEKQEDLETLMFVLRKDGLRVEDFSELDENPYIYCYNPLEDTSFQGVRIYKHGDILAFKVAKFPDSQPYGAAYSIDLQGMYDALIEEKKEKKDALKELCKKVSAEMRKFFRKSKVAEDKIVKSQVRDPDALDGAGQITIRNTGTDYSNQVYNNNKN